MEDKPPIPALSAVDAIDNLDAARLSLRWALERIHALERALAEREAKARSEGEGRAKAEADYGALERVLSLRPETGVERLAFLKRAEEYVALRLAGKLDLAPVLERERQLSLREDELNRRTREEGARLARLREEAAQEAQRVREGLKAQADSREAEGVKELARRSAERDAEWETEAALLREREAALEIQVKELADREARLDSIEAERRRTLELEESSLRERIHADASARLENQERIHVGRLAAIEAERSAERRSLRAEAEDLKLAAELLRRARAATEATLEQESAAVREAQAAARRESGKSQGLEAEVERLDSELALERGRWEQARRSLESAALADRTARSEMEGLLRAKEAELAERIGELKDRVEQARVRGSAMEVDLARERSLRQDVEEGNQALLAELSAERQRLEAAAEDGARLRQELDRGSAESGRAGKEFEAREQELRVQLADMERRFIQAHESNLRQAALRHALEDERLPLQTRVSRAEEAEKQAKSRESDLELRLAAAGEAPAREIALRKALDDEQALRQQLLAEVRQGEQQAREREAQAVGRLSEVQAELVAAREALSTETGLRKAAEQSGESLRHQAAAAQRHLELALEAEKQAREREAQAVRQLSEVQAGLVGAKEALSTETGLRKAAEQSGESLRHQAAAAQQQAALAREAQEQARAREAAALKSIDDAETERLEAGRRAESARKPAPASDVPAAPAGAEAQHALQEAQERVRLAEEALAREAERRRKLEEWIGPGPA